MRDIVTGDRLLRFMRRLGEAAPPDTRVYLTGGATALLLGWRTSTIDVDVKLVPESDVLFRALPALKEDLNLNVELASPDLFIPALPDWQSRSLFISREGRIDWYHYDPYAQVLAKIERSHQRDLIDVAEFIRRNLVELPQLKSLFERIRPDLIRYPALNPADFERKVQAVLSRV